MTAPTDASRSSRRRPSLAERFDAALPLLLLALGLLHPESPTTYFACFALAFAAIAAPIFSGAALILALSKRFGERVQGPRRARPPIGREAFVTAQASWVAATLAAWPLSQWWLGHPTGMILSLEDAGVTLGAVVLQTFFGVLAIDAWSYWKHRVLHTRPMFVFHKAHHSFRDPTPFAGFAVGPVESLMTFWPILLLCIPAATHWAPLYFGLVLGFIYLNFYLHCGVKLRWVEATLPRLYVNTSGFHNFHHSHVKVNFGEPLTLWDHICKTRLEDAKPTA